MKFLNNDTAILLFSRLPREEAAVKGYGNTLGTQAGLKLAEKMVRATLHVAHSSGYPVFAIYSDKQNGATFGERLANCMEEVYRKGYAKVIVIGSDCPTLSAAVLKRAGQKLDSQTILAAPSSDGGLNLLGVHKDSYSRGMFQEISWCTTTVFEELQQAAGHAGLAFVAEEYADDIDSFSDLLNWSENHHSHSLSSLLTQLITTLIHACTGTPFSKLMTASLHRALLFRGPPVLQVS